MLKSRVEAVNIPTYILSLLVRLAERIELRSTDYEADALTTRQSNSRLTVLVV